MLAKGKLGHQQHLLSSSDSSHLVYPTFPDVKLKKLPFYKIDSILMKPSSLQPTGNARFQEQTFSFHLTPQQSKEIAESSYRDSNGKPEYKKQIQMRFSLLETSCEQDDNFPSSICVKVRNDRGKLGQRNCSTNIFCTNSHKVLLNNF